MKSKTVSLEIPQTARRRFDNVFFATATIGLSATALVGNVIAARFVRPEDMGHLQTALLIAGYLGFLHFGVFSGVQRNLPIALGRNDVAAAEERVAESWFTAKTNAVTCAFFTLLTAAWYSRGGLSPMDITCLFVLAATSISAPLIAHFDLIYRCSQSFRVGGWANMAAAVGSGFLSLLPMALGLAGQVARLIATPVWILATKWYLLPISTTQAPSFRRLCKQAKDGLPDTILTQIYNFFSLADRSLIAVFLTREALGNFTLATMVTTGLQLFPSVVASIMYSRIAFEYGRTSDTSALRPLVWRGLLLSLALCLPVGLITYLSIGPLVHAFMPKYQAGIRAAEISTLGSVLQFYAGAGPVISTLQKSLNLGVVYLIALGGIWLGGIVLIRNGHGIEGIAIVRLLATALLGIATIAYAFWLTRRDQK